MLGRSISSLIILPTTRGPNKSNKRGVGPSENTTSAVFCEMIQLFNDSILPQSTCFRKPSRPDQVTNHQKVTTYRAMGFPARFVILSGQMIENEGSQHKFYFEFMMSYWILFLNSGESEAKLA